MFASRIKLIFLTPYFLFGANLSSLRRGSRTRARALSNPKTQWTRFFYTSFYYSRFFSPYYTSFYSLLFAALRKQLRTSCNLKIRTDVPKKATKLHPVRLLHVRDSSEYVRKKAESNLISINLCFYL